jgi:hypothetical protein
MAITYEGIFVINYMVIIANEICKKGGELQFDLILNELGSWIT